MTHTHGPTLSVRHVLIPENPLLSCGFPTGRTGALNDSLVPEPVSTGLARQPHTYNLPRESQPSHQEREGGNPTNECACAHDRQSAHLFTVPALTPNPALNTELQTHPSVHLNIKLAGGMHLIPQRWADVRSSMCRSHRHFPGENISTSTPLCA